MPWWLRILDISFFALQFVLLMLSMAWVNPEGLWGALGFVLLYVVFLYITMGICINILPKRYQKYFKDRSPDNPEGCRDIFTYIADTYHSIRTKLK